MTIISANREISSKLPICGEVHGRCNYLKKGDKMEIRWKKFAICGENRLGWREVPGNSLKNQNNCRVVNE